MRTAECGMRNIRAASVERQEVCQGERAEAAGGKAEEGAAIESQVCAAVTLIDRLWLRCVETTRHIKIDCSPGASGRNQSRRFQHNLFRPDRNQPGGEGIPL